MAESKEANQAVVLKTFEILFIKDDYPAAEQCAKPALGDHFDCIDS